MYNLLMEHFTYNQRVSLLLTGLAVVTGLLAALGFQFDETVGVILSYATGGLLVMAVVHHWRKPVRFALLAVVGFVGFFVFVVVHNLAYAAAEMTQAYPLVSGFFSVIDVVGFLIAIIVAPAAAAIGVVGTAVTWWLQRKEVE